MSSRPLPNKVPRHRWQALRHYLTGFMLVLAILFLNSIPSSVNGQSANIDQGANEKVTTPVSPVSWINGNLNSNQAHFLEGYSIPYRAILGDLVVGKTYTLVIAFDQRDGSKHALDYITHFQRLESHAIFGHAAETVNPLLDITGFPASYFTTTDVLQIPAPSVTGSPVAGQPATSFNALPAGEQVMTGYNMDLLSIVYNSPGSLTDAHSETVIHVTFTAQKETAVLAWGGHIASQIDWGKGESASAISGSPYHMRLKKWIIDGVDVSIGNQDRSLKTDAVFIPPKCDVTGPHTGCVENTSLSFTSTVDDANGLTYLWSIIGANTAQAKIVDNTAANIQVVPIGSAFQTGSFNLQLIVTRDGLKDTCYIDSHTSPGVNVVITDVNVSAGADQEIDHLSTANLNAVGSGGTEPYGYKWSPVTGLSDPNIANPVFTPPGTGVFQFIVTATDANGCVGKDTVVITVKLHEKPPCGIDGPDPICPGSTNTYKGPAPSTVGSYLWSVTGDASIVGPTNRDSVVIKADNKCGSYTIKLIVTTTDNKVKDSCFKTVQIKDEIKPVLHGTANDANVTCAKDVPAAPAITATDNCQAEIEVKFSQITEDSTCINKFRIVRKWWATDVCNNTSDTLKQVITVNDNVKPLITADFPKEVNIQCLKDVPLKPSATATDNCDGTLQPVYTEEGSGTGCDSTITRKWVFTDACGNSDEVTQTIHVKDDIKPVLHGEAKDATVVCAKDVPAPPTITATDNCSENLPVKYSQETKDSSCPNRFKLVRKWWAVDDCGNKSDTITQLITVYDDVKPVITADFDKEIWVQCLKDIPAAPIPTATDNCNGEVKPTFRDEGSGSACDSTLIRTWIFEDACGNKDSVKQVIHVKDDIKPVLQGEAKDATVVCAKDVPAPPTITATDNCAAYVPVKYSQETKDSTCPNRFKLLRKWWAVDNCGNKSDTIKQLITVYDDVKPVISADFNKYVNVQCVKDIPAAPKPTATDNCNGEITPVYTEKGYGNACDSTINRKWVFTDACGNTDSVKQVIHVKDDTRPSISGNVSDKTVVCAKDVPAPPTVTSTDNCDLYPYIKYWQVTKDSSCPNRFKLVRKWYAIDDCGNKSDTLTQIITVYDDVKPVITANFPKEVWIQCVKDIPAAPTPTASDNCGNEVKTVFTCTGSGTACDSTINRKWVFLDACWNKDSVTQVIHIKDNTKPTLSGSVYDKTVACAKDVPAPPTVTATDNCDPYPYLKYTEVKTDVICVNKFKLLRKWWAKDKCGNVSDTLRQTITVYDNIAPTVTYKPADKNVTCGNDRSFGIPKFADNCGCTPTVTYEDKQSGYTCPITYTRTWTAKDECGNWVKTQQCITVGCCDKQCTLTQGFYGNVNGLACTPAGAKLTATQIMTAAVDAQDGDSVIFGLKATGKFFTLFLTDVSNGNIFKMLPGGGTPAALKGYTTYSKTATWPNIPINVSSSNYGKINNVLLAQTMTMFFNMNLSPTLGSFPIKNDTLFTSKLPTCGSTIPSNTIDKYILAKSVVTYLQNTGQASIQGLFNLANKYLGGQTVTGVSASDVNQSVDAINKGFDQCAVLFRWGTNSYAPLVQTGASMDANVTVYKQTVSNESGELQVKVFPNPYTDKLIFRFTAPVSGRTILEMFNVQGQRLDVVDKGMVDKGTTHTIQYDVKEAFRGPLIYKLNVGHLNASGKVISFK